MNYFSTLFCYTSLHVSDRLTVFRDLLPFLNTCKECRVSVDHSCVDCLFAATDVTDRSM